MEMLALPRYGLDQGRYTFFLRPNQTMQLVATKDIGRFVAAVFTDPARFGGRTVRLAGDTVTGDDLQSIFTEAAGRPVAYARFPAELLANNPDLAHMSKSLESGPLSNHTDLAEMREVNPSVEAFREWLRGDGLEAFAAALDARPARNWVIA